MTAKYQLLVHPELRDQLRKLHAKARQNPSGPEATEFEAVRKGLSALRDGREADFSGELGSRPRATAGWLLRWLCWR
jgi:hypothetical protein